MTHKSAHLGYRRGGGGGVVTVAAEVEWDAETGPDA